MLPRLSLIALLVASVMLCQEYEIISNLRDAGARKVAVMGLRGRLKANENYDLATKDRKAITGAFANPSSAVTTGLDVKNKHIDVSRANEKLIEGTFKGSKFIAIKTISVIVASVWPASNRKAGAEMRLLADHLRAEGY